MPRGAKGEIDLVGYDGETLAFVEVRTRTLRADLTTLPELSITTDKQRAVVRTAQRFLAERHVSSRPSRFDVVAIDNHPATPPPSASTKTPSTRNCKTRLRRGTIPSRALSPTFSLVRTEFEEACFAGVA